jgi:hypothetical protein
MADAGCGLMVHRSKPLEAPMPTEPYTDQMRSYPRVEAFIDMFFDWVKHRREIAETCNCDARDLSRIAHDLGVSPGDLDELVRRGQHAADELPRLMKQLKLDPESIARTQALVMHDMERVCAQCSSKARCDQDLAQGTSQQHYDEYCGNALTLQSLGAKETPKEQEVTPAVRPVSDKLLLFP